MSWKESRLFCTAIMNWFYMSIFKGVTVSFFETILRWKLNEIENAPSGKKKSQEPTRGCRMYGVECINHLIWSFLWKFILVPIYFRSLFDARTSTSLNPYHLYNDKLGVGIIRSTQPFYLRICVKRKARLFSRCTLPKANMEPENAPWKREAIYKPTNCFSFHVRFQKV